MWSCARYVNRRPDVVGTLVSGDPDALETTLMTSFKSASDSCLWRSRTMGVGVQDARALEKSGVFRRRTRLKLRG